MRKFNITVNGTNYEVDVEEIVDGVAQPSVAPVAQAAPKAAPKKAAAPAVGAGEPVKAPMPGLVKELKVANGATVKKGDAVVVLEAMKMDNDIAATCDGVVTYSVSAGSNVNSGDGLCTIA